MATVSKSQVEQFMQQVAEKWEPQLEGSCSVELDTSQSYQHRARKVQGRVRLTCAFGPGHPDFKELFRRGVRSALQIRRGTTNAVEIRGETID